MPPTADAVQACLDWVMMPPDQLIGIEPVRGLAITAEKLKHSSPDLMLRPNVGIFRTLDFFQASAILRAAEPAKAEIKQKLAALLDS